MNFIKRKETQRIDGGGALYLERGQAAAFTIIRHGFEDGIAKFTNDNILLLCGVTNALDGLR